ncbi:hypothetical protein J7T55_010080 [Diaporthe amygdali]|uniref:uncharacterized protein n=1 Tax=Phomopsis amygdali TaxID=1214568 RepID=UPI0022FDC9C6|nr:uncharacterized protein J7T55_010080 [Diaporthe amygdali]KAJ0113836.1 hypothetical protein J7T55_010080 [Diaporthe amygdali]
MQRNATQGNATQAAPSTGGQTGVGYSVLSLHAETRQTRQNTGDKPCLSSDSGSDDLRVQQSPGMRKQGPPSSLALTLKRLLGFGDLLQLPGYLPYLRHTIHVQYWSVGRVQNSDASQRRGSAYVHLGGQRHFCDATSTVPRANDFSLTDEKKTTSLLALAQAAWPITSRNRLRKSWIELAEAAKASCLRHSK